MIYDIIIIGGGIAGLYTAYNLLKTDNLKILILEKNNYLGGRIKTIKITKNKHTFNFEEGSGRFNDNHKLFIKLIEELDLSDKITEIGSHIKFTPSFDYENKETSKYINDNPFKYIRRVIKYSLNDTKENIRKYTFIEYAKKILTPIEIKFLIDSFGYYTELVSMNAYNAFYLFNKGMSSYLKFYSLNYIQN